MTNDDTQPVSGSRWERDGDQSPETPAAADESPPAPPDLPATPPVAAPAAGDPAATGRPRRSKLVLAGAAAGLALVAGTGGFALGHATAGHDDRGRVGLVGSDDADGRGPAGFPARGDQDGDGRGGVPPQGLPPQGVLPPPGDPGGDDGTDGATGGPSGGTASGGSHT